MPTQTSVTQGVDQAIASSFNEYFVAPYTYLCPCRFSIVKRGGFVAHVLTFSCVGDHVFSPSTTLARDSRARLLERPQLWLKMSRDGTGQPISWKNLYQAGGFAIQP